MLHSPSGSDLSCRAFPNMGTGLGPGILASSLWYLEGFSSLHSNTQVAPISIRVVRNMSLNRLSVVRMSLKTCPLSVGIVMGLNP